MTRAGVLWFALLASTGCDQVFGLADRDAGDDAHVAPLTCPDVFLGQRFLEYQTVGLWLPAEAYCESLDPDPNDQTYVHLAVLSGGADQVAIAGLSPGNEVWVGLTDRKLAPSTPDPSAFVWITEESVPAFVWGATEPDAGGPARCGYLVVSDGEIHDATCPNTTLRTAICECDQWPVVPARFTP